MHGELHGISHWDRVCENEQLLLAPGVNPLVVGLFAYLHDFCHMDDGEDLYQMPVLILVVWICGE